MHNLRFKILLQYIGGVCSCMLLVSTIRTWSSDHGQLCSALVVNQVPTARQATTDLFSSLNNTDLLAPKSRPGLAGPPLLWVLQDCPPGVCGA